MTTKRETVTISIECARGYSGMRSAKSYIAKITGTSQQFIFSREFVSTAATDPSECFRARRKGKGTWREAAALDSGLYEIQQYGDRTYRIVWLDAARGVVSMVITEDRAAAMALAMDDGKSFEQARIATRKITPKTLDTCLMQVAELHAAY